MLIFPASGVVPTVDRPEALRRTLQSLHSQDWQPQELIIADASRDDRTRDLIASLTADFAATGCRLIWQHTDVRGAAAQRNHGVTVASQPIIWFFDDDVLFEPHCIERLWAALQSDSRLGGVNAMIVNQRYHPPGRVSGFMFRLMAGEAKTSYAGRVLGPGINLLPEDRQDLPDVVPVEWLNTTCTLYRRSTLPIPTFSENFTGYSLLEDLALSLRVKERWELANVRTARIFHDSQPGIYKDDVAVLSRMELVNRHNIMINVLRRRGMYDYTKLALWELFQLAAGAIRTRCGPELWKMLLGKILGIADILHDRMAWRRS